PVACIKGSLWMRHAHRPWALGALRQIGNTPSGADRLLPHAPDAGNGGAVRATRGREAMQAPRALVGGEGRGERGRPMAPTAIDDPHDRWAGCAASGPEWLESGASRWGRPGRHDGRATGRGPRGARADDAEQHAAGAPPPRALRPPRGAFEGRS